MSSLELFHYSGQQVRTVLIDGEPWFVAADVCAILGIANSRDALARLDDDEKGVGTTDTPGGPQRVSIVNEPGVYGLTWTSRKAEAAQFRRWVKHEVLPQIRRTGQYGSQVPTSFAEALELAAAKQYAIEAAEAKLAEQAPKVEAYERLMDADGYYSTADKKKAPAPALESAAEATPNHQSIGATEVSHNNQRQQTAASNLQQAAAIEKSSNWTIARLIAASVEGRQGSRSDLVPRGTKLGTTEAATTMGRSKSTILAYLSAWNAAAEDGHCTPSTDLTPDDGWTADLPADHLWEKYRNPNSHSTKTPKTSTLPADPVVAADTASERMTTKQRQEWVTREIQRDVEVATAADQALEDRRCEHPKPERETGTPNTGKQDTIRALVKTRKIHREMVELVSMVNDIPAEAKGAVKTEMEWVITAAETIRMGCESPESMDEQIAALLDAEGDR